MIECGSTTAIGVADGLTPYYGRGTLLFGRDRMRFKAAKAALVAALREGDFDHEPRGVISEKNLPAVGDVEPGDVAALVLRTRAIDHDESPHHWDESVTVHAFRPTKDDERWYIKA